jgi:subtilisin family serine protease
LTNFLTEKLVSFSKIWIINAIHIKSASLELARELSLRDDVVEIVHDQKYTISPMERSIASKKSNPRIEWNIDFVKASKVHAKGFTGKGKVVGVVDTGCNFRHPSLFEKYVGNVNGTVNHDFAWFDPNGRMQEPQDTQDHGSHCTGTVLGSTKTPHYITGASYGSKWIHCHFGGTFAAITKCFQFMLAPTTRTGANPTPSKRPHVTTHSYGGGGQTRSLLEDVVKPVIDAGVHVVVAAHNYARCRAVTDPGIIPTVLTVGALGFNSSVIAPFSSKGPNNAHYQNGLKPEISAPGVNIISANGQGTGYSTKSGTSMATPLVAGVISLLWEAVPALDRQIEKTNKILYQTAAHQESTECESKQPTPNNVYGHGTINAWKAYKKAKALYGDK